jgi:hypothetical protein
LTGHKWWWAGGLAVTSLVIFALTISSQVWRLGPGRRGLVQVPLAANWVDRRESRQVVSALTANGEGLVAVTTSLAGAGGFGKTMLAARACRDIVVRRLFRGGIFWVTIGRDADETDLVNRINDLVRNMGEVGAAFAAVDGAATALAGALKGRGPTLLVADDVWTEAQLAPFAGAGASRLLVTTRRPWLLAGSGGQRIVVDAVDPDAARRILGLDLPPIRAHLERDLLALAGGWPLLLSLINRRLADDVQRHGVDIDSAAKDAAIRLAQPGRTALDISDSGRREMAVAASIDYSLETLSPGDRERFCELGIFPEDTEIPVGVAALLWRATGHLTDPQTLSLCDRLDGLSLLSQAGSGDCRVLLLHDVVREFAITCLGGQRCTAAHAGLVTAARTRVANDELSGAAWWQLPEDAVGGYLLDRLAYHHHQAGLDAALDQVVGDLRFLAVRLIRSGPAAVEADLIHSSAAPAARLRRAVACSAHLLGSAEPRESLATVLTSRIGDMPETARQERM